MHELCDTLFCLKLSWTSRYHAITLLVAGENGLPGDYLPLTNRSVNSPELPP